LHGNAENAKRNFNRAEHVRQIPLGVTALSMHVQRQGLASPQVA
jgi:hypothetical protein